MKRSFPPPARKALGALLGALACGAACEPNHNVKPGAPELIEFTIVQAGPKATTITSDKPDCAATTATGDPCKPSVPPPETPDTLCRLATATTMNWCMCNGTDPNDETKGAWNCDPFGDVTAVIAVFDRLLDTTPLDPGDAAGLTDVVMTSAAGGTTVDVLSDYSSTGQQNGLIFNLFGPAFFGNFRSDGPSLFTAPPGPAFASAQTLTFTLNGNKVLAKDGHTQFVGAGPLMGGSLTFMTAPFSVSVIPPDPMALMMDMTLSVPATVAFTNLVASDSMSGAIDPVTTITAATSTGTPIPIVTKTSDGGASFSVNATTVDAMGMTVVGPWPTGATVVITVAGTIKDLLGESLPAGATGMFTVP